MKKGHPGLEQIFWPGFHSYSKMQKMSIKAG